MNPQPSETVSLSVAPGTAVPSYAQLWAILRAYRFWIGLVTLTLVASAAVLSEGSRQVFRATATLRVGLSPNPVPAAAGGEAKPLRVDPNMAMQMELVRGPHTLLLATEDLRLQDDARYADGYQGDGSEESLRRWAAERLREKLLIDHGGDNRLLYVSAEDADPAEAARLANGVAEAFASERLLNSPIANLEVIDYHSAQLGARESRILAAQEALQAYRQRVGLLGLADEGPVDASLLAELERRQSEARDRRLAAERELDAIDDEDSAALDSGPLRSLRARIAADDRDLKRLRETLGSRHPDVIARERRLDETREQAKDEVAEYRKKIKGERDTAADLEVRYKQEYARQKQRYDEARETIEEGRRLKVELQSEAQAYFSAFDFYDRLRSASSGPLRQADLAARAEVPNRPQRLEQRPALLLALIGGLIGSVAASLALGLTRRRIRCREDLERGLGVPVLGELPGAA